MPDFGINDFALRHTPDNHFSYYEPPEGEVWGGLLRLVEENWDKAKPGYRDGVVLVPVPPEHFYSSEVTLKKGDWLRGTYDSRREGEHPRKSIQVVRKGMRTKNRHDPAKFVNIVLYHRDVLAEDEPDGIFHEWEIVTILASSEDNPPMDPDTFMANHFGADGGTDTKMTDAEFVAELRRCWEYWKDRALLASDK